eukprot:293523-Chlamydomonas_euryale.AAC.2
MDVPDSVTQLWAVLSRHYSSTAALGLPSPPRELPLLHELRTKSVPMCGGDNSPNSNSSCGSGSGSDSGSSERNGNSGRYSIAAAAVAAVMAAAPAATQRQGLSRQSRSGDGRGRCCDGGGAGGCPGPQHGTLWASSRHAPQPRRGLSLKRKGLLSNQVDQQGRLRGHLN